MPRVSIRIDDCMLLNALDIPLWLWAADSFSFAGVTEFTLICPEERFAMLKFPGKCTRADNHDGDIIIDSARLITRAGARALIKTGKAAAGVYPVSDPASLLSAQKRAREEIVQLHMENGVFFMDENAVYIDPRATLGRGCFVLPGTVISGECRIGENCRLGPQSVINSCVLEDGVTVNASQVNESKIGSGTTVGPFSYVRPGCSIGSGCKIGDFVEVKNSAVGDDSKFSHLTYVGDSDVGSGVNLGCGTVTVNYDGREKYRCTIGDGAFVGCNTNLIAPVAVGEGAYIAAGTTLTDDVPAKAFAIGRSRQVTKPGRSKRR